MFLAGHEPHGQEPEPQWLPGSLENRPRNHRCLALARRTVEKFALRRPRLASSTAMGTRETRRPAQLSKVTPACRLVSEPRVEFLESARIIDAADGMARRFHPLMLSLNATGVKRIPPYARICCFFKLEWLTWPHFVGAGHTQPSLGLPTNSQRASRMKRMRGVRYSTRRAAAVFPSMTSSVPPVSYTHLTLPTTPYV